MNYIDFKDYYPDEQSCKLAYKAIVWSKVLFARNAAVKTITGYRVKKCSNAKITLVDSGLLSKVELLWRIVN